MDNTAYRRRLEEVKPITIHTRWFPAKGFHAITLFPVVFYRDGRLTPREVRHETVHLWQQALLLVVPFYVLYLLFWVVGLLRYRDANRAYREIPFERSAYMLEQREDLTWKAMAFGWVRCLAGDR